MRIRTVSTAIAAGAAALICAAAPASAATPAVHLARVQYDAPGRDSGSNVNGEYVTVTNSGHASVQLKGWTLRDAQRHVYTFPSHTLKPGASVRVHTGKGHNSGSTLYWGMGWHVWNNTGDTATLRTARGTTDDTCHYRGTKAGTVGC